MHFKQTLAVGLILALPVFINQLRLEAGGPLCGHKDCPSQDTTVRLPAQEIRIETTRPRVIVSEAPAVGRVRHGFGVAAGYGVVPMMAAQPFVASIYMPASGFADPRMTSDNSALRYAQEMELKFHEVNQQKMAHQAHIDAADRVLQRMKAQIGSPTSSSGNKDLCDMQSKLADISNRLDTITNLLQVHDNAIRDLLKKKSGN